MMKPDVRRGASGGRLRGMTRGLVAASATGVLAGLALACDTPVYRYAMYRWPPAPYHVLYFHRGSPEAKDGEVNRLLDEAGAKAAPANVAFESIDVSKDETLKLLPEEIRSVWQAHRDKPLPRHVILAPRLGELWSGRLDAAEAQRLLQSPLRTKIAQLLHEGHAAVLVLVPGSDAATTRKAEQAVNEAIAQVASGGEARSSSAVTSPGARGAAAAVGQAGADDRGQGTVVPQPAQGAGSEPHRGPALLTPPADLGAPAEGPKPLRLALVKLDRKDTREQWLLRNLLAVQKVPPEKEKEPLLYAVFGRGRAMGPCIGEQINSDSIDELVAFLGGACSCVIKDQNPGVDLLFAWDWEATAEHLAQTEEPAAAASLDYAEVPADMPPGAPPGAQQPTSDEVCCPVPGSSGATVAGAAGSSGGVASSTGSVASLKGPGEPPHAQAQTTAEAIAPASRGQSGAVDGDRAALAPAGASAPMVSAAVGVGAEPGQPSFATRQLWQFGVGLGVVAVAVFLAGVWVLRKARYETP